MKKELTHLLNFLYTNFSKGTERIVLDYSPILYKNDWGLSGKNLNTQCTVSNEFVMFLNENFSFHVLTISHTFICIKSDFVGSILIEALEKLKING